MANERQIQDIVNKFPNIHNIVTRLNGERELLGRSVLVSDIILLKQIPVKPKSTLAAGTTPTKAEFDALVSDVHAIYNLLVTVATQLK